MGIPDSDAVLTIYVVYRYPSDYPGKWVVRAQQISAGYVEIFREPTIVADTLEEARELIPLSADTCMTRSPEDDPSIWECWM